MKYMIHTCNSRLWYVENFLIPSLIKQGINKDDIYNYVDTKCDGNLVSFVISCHKAYEMWEADENVWHLQDDVLICKDFKQRTEELESFSGLIQGFSCVYDENISPGEDYISENTMWWSMPCIRVNSKTGKLFAEWADTYVWRDSQYGFWVKYKKGDDVIFKVYMINYQTQMKVLRANPNLVEHVDWLIGGSTVNRQRESSKKIVRSIYWNDNDLVDKLAEEIHKYDNDNR